MRGAGFRLIPADRARTPAASPGGPKLDRCLGRFLLYDGFVSRVPACHIAGEDPAPSLQISSLQIASLQTTSLQITSSSKKYMFKRILIANRGEIACRVIKTARRMG